MSDLTGLGYDVQQAVVDAVDIGRQIEAGLRPDIAEEIAPSRVRVTGGTVESWSTVVETFPCRVTVRQGTDVATIKGREVRQFYDITAPHGTHVDPSHRLRVRGVMYAIMGEDNEQSYATATHVLCYEVQDNGD